MAVDGREILPWDARLSFKKNCRISQWPIHSTNSWVVNCVVEDCDIFESSKVQLLVGG